MEDIIVTTMWNRGSTKAISTEVAEPFKKKKKDLG